MNLLSIIVPVKNEHEGIAAFIQTVQKKVRSPFEILIVYDCDEDTTLEAVNLLLERSPELKEKVFLLKNSVCRGPSGAIRTGFKQARGTDFLVTMADLSDDLGQVDNMRVFIEDGYDLVCPSRYCRGGRQELSSLKAKIPRFVGWVLQLVCGFPCRDTTNSFRLYSRNLISSMRLSSTHSFSVSLEIMVKAHSMGYRIKEIPTVWNTRRVGESKFPFLASLVSYLPWFVYAIVMTPRSIHEKRTLPDL